MTARVKLFAVHRVTIHLAAFPCYNRAFVNIEIWRRFRVTIELLVVNIEIWRI